MGDSLTEFFGDLEDPRRDQGQRHPLVSLIGIAIIGVLCGADEWTEVEEVAWLKADWLKTFLDLPHGIPSHDTLSRVFGLLEPEAFSQALLGWIQHVAALSRGELVSIDGKTLRRSYDTASGQPALHMISAWCQQNQIVLGQLATDLKDNEITAIPRLLELLDLAGAVVTIDAIGCQHDIVRQILQQNGDYLIQVKSNQGALYDDLKLYFDQMKAEGFESVPHAKATTTEGQHGRVETRTAWSLWQIDWLKQRHAWAGLNSIVCIEAQRAQDGQTSTERRYYISSLDGRNAAYLLNASRGHWGIENRLHWSLDVTFKEDHSRVRKDHGPANFAALRRAILGLLKQETTAKTSLKGKRRRCAMAHNYLETVLSLP